MNNYTMSERIQRVVVLVALIVLALDLFIWRA
jgi:hypothetical protein